MKKILSLLFILSMATNTSAIESNPASNSSDDNKLITHLQNNWGKYTTAIIVGTLIWDNYKNNATIRTKIYELLGLSAIESEEFIKKHPAAKAAIIVSLISADMLLHQKYEDTFLYIIPNFYNNLTEAGLNAIYHLHKAYHKIGNPFKTTEDNL